MVDEPTQPLDPIGTVLVLCGGGVQPQADPVKSSANQRGFRSCNVQSSSLKKIARPAVRDDVTYFIITIK